MFAKLCAVLLLSTAFGTVDGNVLYDTELTFESTIAADANKYARITFAYDEIIATSTEIKLALPNFNVGSLAAAKASGGGCGTATIALCTAASTGIAGTGNYVVCFKIATNSVPAITPCTVEIGDLTMPTAAEASDFSSYTLTVGNGATQIISRSEAITVAAVNKNAVTFSQHAVGTATDVTYTFNYATTFDNSNNDFILLALPHFTGTPATVSTCGTTTWTPTVVGSAGSFEVKLAATAATLSTSDCTIVITGLTSPARENNFAANSRTIKSTFTISSAEVVKDAVVLSSDSIGVPSLYSIKSECRTGGVSSGSLVTCDVTSSCLACTGSEGFFKTYGTSCKTSDKVRCDARISAQTSVDIYLNPNGVPGTVTCGAFVEDGAMGVWDQSTDPVPPTDHISGLSTGTSANSLYSRNAAVVSSANTANDHVVTLNRLKSDTLYHVYCHGDDFKLSEFLDVHTLPNTFVTGISLTVATLTGGQSPGTLTLKLTHGATLASADTITMVVAPYKIFTASSTDAVCSATSAGTSIALTSATGEDSTLIVTLGAGSAAGSELVISCTGSLASNVATGAAVRITSVAVSDHTTVYGVSGYTTT